MPGYVNRLLALSVLVWCCPGCLLTEAMWDRAGPAEVREPLVIGVWEAATAQGRPVPQLLLSYSVGRGELVCTPPTELYALIPLIVDYTAPYPFGYAGDKRRLSEIEADLGPERHDAIGHTRFRLMEECDVRDIVKSPDFHPRDTAPDGFWGEPYGLQARPVTWIAYRTHSDDLKAHRQAISDTDPTFPPEVHVMFLPWSQPRPPDEHARAKFGAALMTPLALVADVVFTPAVAVGFALFGFQSHPTAVR